MITGSIGNRKSVPNKFAESLESFIIHSLTKTMNRNIYTVKVIFGIYQGMPCVSNEVVFES